MSLNETIQVLQLVRAYKTDQGKDLSFDKPTQKKIELSAERK